MPHLILIRHGKSELNLQDRFAGWVDTPLAELGREDAREAARMLRDAKLKPKHVFVSPLTRARETWLEMLPSFPESQAREDWRLMERHYGAFSGASREEIKSQLGDDVYLDVRRGYAKLPDEIPHENPNRAAIAAMAAKIGIPEARVPLTESLQLLAEGRVKEAWEESIRPLLEKGEDVLVVSHGNTMRALTAIIEKLGPEEIRKVEYKQGEPIDYEFGPGLQVLGKRNLKEDLAQRPASGQGRA